MVGGRADVAMKWIVFALTAWAVWGQGSVNTQQTFQAPPIFSSLPNATTIGTDSHGKVIQSSVVASTGNVLIASQIPGVVLDAVIGSPASPGNGTQTCTHNAATLLSAMSAVLATYTSVELDLDGASCLEESLALPQTGNVTIRGIGQNAGFMPISGCNCSVITNSYSYPTTGTAPSQAAGTIIIRDIGINGNQTYNTGSTSIGILLLNLRNVLIEHTSIFNYPSFGIALDNIGTSEVLFNYIVQAATNRDPIHYLGPNGYIRVVGNTIGASDDCLALNAPEGYGGNIGQVYAAGNQMVSCSDFMRIYNHISSSYYTVGPVVVDGLTGTATASPNAWLFYFPSAGSAADLASVHVSHVDVSSPGGLAYIDGSFGDLLFSDCIIRNPTQGDALIEVESNDSPIGSLTVEDSGYERTTSGSTTTAPVINITNDSVVGRVVLRNVFCEDEAGESYTACPSLIDVISLSVGSVEFEGPFNANGKITNLWGASSIGSITSVAGADNFVAKPSASCGTVSSGSTNAGGTITASGSTGCTITFGGAAAATGGWSCQMSDATAGTMLPQTGGTSTTAVFGGSITASDTLYYGPCRSR